ncbi:NAD(P)H-dependent oxidoreductase [soil metagenome]
MPTDTKIANSAITEALNWRYATKQFDSTKKVSAADWQILEDSLRLAPSSFGLQPYKFVVVTDQKVKEELVAAAWNQAQVAQCSHFVIFARNTDITVETVDRYIELIASTRGVSVETLKPLHGMMSGFVAGSTPEKLAEWAARQTYIALGNLMTAAAIIGVDACPMEGIVIPEVDRILNLNEKGCSSVVACAVGYRAADDKYAALKKVRLPEEELFIRI